MRQTRRVIVAAVLVLAGTVSPMSAVPASAAGAGTITRFAGGLGYGPATNLAMVPIGLAWRDGRLLIADTRHPVDSLHTIGEPYPGVIRSVDAATGLATVVAGVEVGGFSGDGGPATQAQFNNPIGLAFDEAGNLYVADGGNNRVRRISPGGAISTVAGNGAEGPTGDGGPATATALRYPRQVEVATDGSLLLPESGRLRRVDASGIISTLAGADGPSPPAPPTSPTLGDVRPSVVAAGPGGKVYFFDPPSRRLFELSPGGALSVVPTGLEWIGAVTVERTGTLLVSGGASLHRVDPLSGRVELLAGTPGRPGFAGDGGPATGALLGEVSDVVVDDAGVIYLADRRNYRVRRITLDGTMSTVAGNGMASHGGVGGLATAAQLTWASNIEATATGTYFMESDERDRIARVSTVGLDGRLRAGADLPDGVAGMVVDATGNVYLSGGSQVVKLSPAGERTVVAGTGTPGFSGDGGPAVQAQLSIPTAMALDGRGDLYIADNAVPGRGGLVRKVDRAGRISTVAGGAATIPPYHAAVLARNVHFGNILDIDVDIKGSLVVLERTDWGPYNVRRVTCGIAGSLPIVHSLGHSSRIALDGAGTIYLTRVNHANSSVVSRIDAQGRVLEDVVGGGTERRFEGRPATSVRLQTSGALAIDGAGNLLVGLASGIARVEGVAVPARPPGVPCETVPDRPVWGLGSNVVSQLGDGSTVDRDNVAFEDPVVTGAVAVTGGTFHSLALKADGTVWAWGWNGFGQLGDGTTLLRSRAVQVPGLTGVKAVAAGAYGSMALKTDGTVWAWGWNGYGQLGDGTTADRHRPVRVAGLQNVTAISANMVHSMAVTLDGTAWTWGWNGFGLLGDGTNWERHVPGRVAGLAAVTSVAAGYFHSLATTADGRVWSWGWNAQGQLGDGSITDRWLPVRIAGITGATAVAAGNNHSVALAGEQTWTWGWNAFGQLGRVAPGHSPTPLPSYSGILAIAAGAYHTVALTRTGSGMTMWGWNGFGQSYARPGPDHPVAVGAGAYHTMAVYQLTP